MRSPLPQGTQWERGRGRGTAIERSCDCRAETFSTHDPPTCLVLGVLVCQHTQVSTATNERPWDRSPMTPTLKGLHLLLAATTLQNPPLL